MKQFTLLNEDELLEFSNEMANIRLQRFNNATVLKVHMSFTLDPSLEDLVEATALVCRPFPCR